MQYLTEDIGFGGSFVSDILELTDVLDGFGKEQWVSEYTYQDWSNFPQIVERACGWIKPEHKDEALRLANEIQQMRPVEGPATPEFHTKLKELFDIFHEDIPFIVMGDSEGYGVDKERYREGMQGTGEPEEPMTSNPEAPGFGVEDINNIVDSVVASITKHGEH